MYFEKLTNTRDRYGLVAQLLHWSVAILILLLLPLGVIMEQMPASNDSEISNKVWLYSLHKTLGMIVLTLAVFRVAWALVNKRPQSLHPEKVLETLAAETVHWVLYVSIILVPLTGYMHHLTSVGFAPVWGPYPKELPMVPKSLELSERTGNVHFALAVLMAVSIGLHIAGAIKHVVIDRDDTLRRMLPATSGKGAVNTTGSPVSIMRHGIAVGIATVLLASTISLANYDFSNSQAPADEIVAESATHGSERSEYAASPNAWVVDHAQSALAITISQMGADVQGSFSTWSADIVFDREKLSEASVSVRIAIESLQLGAVTEQAKSADFLDASQFPEAVFSGNSFVETDTGYRVDGSLKLHGVEVPVNLPFELEIDGNTATVLGSTTLNRMNFGVGETGFPDEASVGFDVTVTVSLTARRAE